MSKRILVVDDEVNIVKLLESRLTANGYTVITAYNGREALDKVKQEKDDLIILDLMLPDIDGYEVLRELRLDEYYKEVPIIMLTAKGEMGDIKKGMEGGAVSYITKPFKPDTLLGIVKGLLRE
jgi:DNA-binding response OmpR family regulator